MTRRKPPWMPEAKCPRCGGELTREYEKDGNRMRYCRNQRCDYVYILEAVAVADARRRQRR